MSTANSTYSPEWTASQKFLFRLFALYFVIQSLPLDAGFFRQIFNLGKRPLNYSDIFNLAHYSPNFFGGAESFANWLVVLLVAVAGAIIWTYRDKTSREYNALYYWVRVIVRYRLAIGIIAYGFIKVYTIQSPYPSLSNLNTNYGDFTRWKLFSLSLGIVPSYQAFLGLVEVFTGILLLFRKTAVIGAFFIVIFTGNVFMSNIAYEGGHYVYSFYLISLALFILVYDLQRIIRLLVLQKPTLPNRFKPVFTADWQRYLKWTVKGLAIFFFVILYGFKTRQNAEAGLVLHPSTPGLRGVAGIYNVSEFAINNRAIPYSKEDSLRWQDVVFEKWNTLSIKSNRRVIIDSNNVDKLPVNDDQRNYELEGSIERHYYRYDIDSVNRKLTLHNKNPHYAGEKLVLNYETSPSEILLSGQNENGDSVHVELDKIDKKYLIEEVRKLGRRGKLSL